MRYIVIFVLGIGVIVAAALLLMRSTGLDLFRAPAAAVQPASDSAKDKQEAASHAKAKHASKPAKPSAGQTAKVDEPTVVAVPDSTALARPVVAAPAPAVYPFPTGREIQAGAEKPDIMEKFGQPQLTATTADDGHVFQTLAYKSQRTESMTLIFLVDGRVASARSR